MHLATLMTNTDESDFAQRHPKDSEKFAAMIHWVRPDWQVTSFAVKDGVFPADICGFDGIMITGSPASVLEDTPWLTRLLSEIRVAFEAGVPIFGACFGHQALALALGGTVARNTDWGFGLLDMSVEGSAPWFEGGDFRQYAAHIDHVTKLPDGARRLFSTDHCANAGFAIGTQVFTTQNHPEMTPDFVAALVEEYADKMPTDVITAARASLVGKADTLRFAESIARFFEMSAS